MCREEAHRLFARKKELDAMGVRLLCVVKEAIPEQIDQFVPKYWGEESDSDLYLDEELQFFKFLGGGEEQSKGLFALASSAVRSANSRAGAYLKSVGGDSNLTGEGWILGGLLVVRPGGEVEYQHAESTFGDMADLDEVMRAAQSASDIANMAELNRAWKNSGINDDGGSSSSPSDEGSSGDENAY